MLTNTTSSSQRNKSDSISIYPLLFILILICYYNSFHCEWHLDDVQNILQNSPLHITDLSNASLKQTFFAYPGQFGKLLRPVSNLSFALNWFFGQDRVFGYHLVNFIIHVFTAFFLYQSCLLLLSTPRFSSRYQNSKFFIAALATVLWSINPIQTQAITYIVQRAAAWAALFSIIGIWFYLKARLSDSVKLDIFFYFCTTLSFLLAIGSKENAVLFPISLLLIEFLFFQNSVLNKQIIFLSIIVASIVVSLILALGGIDFFAKIFLSYQDRSFSVWQRLATQPRIILFYISLLLYPSPLRLSIEHDVQISTSLISPPTTIIAFFFLIGLIAYSLLQHKKNALFSFAILFFLINHSVESSILNLELIFEHRNYLPSLFFFLPIAAMINFLIEKYKQKNRIIYGVVCVGTVNLIILLSLATILRNIVWQTDTSLWADALAKAPKSSRPYINLGYNLQYEGDYQRAFDLYQRSLDKYSSTPWKDRTRANNGLGNIFIHIGKYKQAGLFFDQAAQIAKNKSRAMYLESILFELKALWLNDQHDEAIKLADSIASKGKISNSFMQFYAEMLIADNRSKKALELLRKVISDSTPSSTEYQMALLDLAGLYNRNERKADLYLRLARELGTSEVPTLFCLLDHYILVNNQSQAKQVFIQLLNRLTWIDLIANLEKLPSDYPALPISPNRLRQYAEDWLAAQRNS